MISWLRTLIPIIVLTLCWTGIAKGSVELGACVASLQNDEVEISWRTDSEFGNVGFQVQRFTDDGSWVDVSFVSGAGTTSEPRTYRNLPTAPSVTGSLTYRLQQENTDGTVNNICRLQIGSNQNMPVTKGIAPLQSEETVDFGVGLRQSDLGFVIATDSVSKSDTARVSKFSTGPSGTDGIEESNASSYRFTVQSDSLMLASDAEIRLEVSTLFGVSEPTNITIYKRPEEGSGVFTELPTSYDSEADELVASTESFSEFVLASESEPLPVELGELKAIRGIENKNVHLTWQTTSETNNAGFEVQRQTKQKKWTQIGYVDSKAEGGTTTEMKSYSYTANDLSVGTHRFRLKQVDLDGSTTLTDPVSVTIQMQKATMLKPPAPNPMSNAATIRFAVIEQSETAIKLYNTLGQQVATIYEGTPQAGEQQTAQMDATGLSSGTYFLRLETAEHTKTERLTVVR